MVIVTCGTFPPYSSRPIAARVEGSAVSFRITCKFGTLLLDCGTNKPMVTPFMYTSSHKLLLVFCEADSTREYRSLRAMRSRSHLTTPVRQISLQMSTLNTLQRRLRELLATGTGSSSLTPTLSNGPRPPLAALFRLTYRHEGHCAAARGGFTRGVALGKVAAAR
jgi:hypothetical protein